VALVISAILFAFFILAKPGLHTRLANLFLAGLCWDQLNYTRIFGFVFST